MAKPAGIQRPVQSNCSFPEALQTLLQWEQSEQRCNTAERELRFDQWLVENRFGAMDVRRCLVICAPYLRQDDGVVDVLRSHADALTADRCELWPSAEGAWHLCWQAITKQIPSLAAPAEAVYRHAPRSLLPDDRKIPMDFTFDLGPGRLPFVSTCYRPCAVGLVHMAHEFGHALQLVARAGLAGATTTVQSETCAFLAERCVAHYIAERDQAETGQHRPLLFAARTLDTAVYCGSNALGLAQALANPAHAYDYTWSYPPARCAAELTALRDGPLVEAFCGDTTSRVLSAQTHSERARVALIR